MRIQDIFENTSDYVRLYRGDSSKINSFDRSKTSSLGLFGQGIYLTDNKRVANDYTSKSNDNDVIFRTEAKNITKKDVLDRYLEKTASMIDLTGKNHSFYGHPIEFSNGFAWARRSHPDVSNEYEKRLDFAKQAWDKIKKNYEIRIRLDGTAVIQKKPQLSDSHTTAFDIPKSYINKTFHADEPIKDDVLNVLLHILTNNNDGSTADAIKQYVKNEDFKFGENPSYRTIYTGIGGASPLYEKNIQDAFIKGLEALGYVGIKYTGGITMGGGYKHSAYVFWNSSDINKFIADK